VAPPPELEHAPKAVASAATATIVAANFAFFINFLRFEIFIDLKCDASADAHKPFGWAVLKTADANLKRG
jgi:hypothetical protein